LIESFKARAVGFKRGVVGTWRQLHIDADHDHRKTTVLAGSGRGGTTWLAELINYENDYRFMFEPFYARHVPEMHAFRNRQYLRPDDDDAAFLEPARCVVTGRLRNRWVDYFNHRFIAKKRLVKEIRANLFLKWLDVHFPGMPIVFVFRHPLAVASSRLYHGWSNDLADFLRQDRLMADFLEPHRRLIETVDDPFEQHVLQWCIENWVPLRQFRRGEIHLAFYENLSVDPRAEIKRLFAFLGRPFTERIFERIDEPSRMTWVRKGADTPQKSDPEAWKPFVSRDRVKRSLEILSRFGLDEVYGEGALPNADAASAMLLTVPMGLKAHTHPAQ
jgi:hypothetical protein